MRMTVTELVEEWLSTCRPAYAQDTEIGYRNHIKAFAKQHSVETLEDFDAEELAAWVHDRKLSPSSQRSRRNALRAFFRWVVQRRYLDADPTELIPAPKPMRPTPKPLKPEEVAAVLRAARRTDADHRSAKGHVCEVMATLMVQEGLRSVEVRRLQVGDVDLDNRQIYLHGKGDRGRVLPLSEQTCSVIRRHLAVIGHRSGPLLSTKGTFEPMSKASVNHRMNRIFNNSGVKRGPYDGKSAHSLRSTAATDVYRECLDVRAVQAMLGHSHLSSTQHYIELATAEHLRDAMTGRRY